MKEKHYIMSIENGNIFEITPKDALECCKESVEFYGIFSLFHLFHFYKIISIYQKK